MKNKVSQKKQLTMFCSLTVAYTSLLVGILRFGLEIADVIFMDAVFNYETCTRLVIYTCIILSAISIVRFLKNVDKGFVFDKKNIYPLRFFAWTVTLTGIILTPINRNLYKHTLRSVQSGSENERRTGTYYLNHKIIKGNNNEDDMENIQAAL